MKIKLLIVLMLVCSFSWGMEHFTTTETEHTVEICGILTYRYPIKLTYSDLILGGKEHAFERWLNEISAMEFINKYCISMGHCLIEKE